MPEEATSNDQTPHLRSASLIPPDPNSAAPLSVSGFQRVNAARLLSASTQQTTHLGSASLTPSVRSDARLTGKKKRRHLLPHDQSCLASAAGILRDASGESLQRIAFMHTPTPQQAQQAASPAWKRLSSSSCSTASPFVARLVCRHRHQHHQHKKPKRAAYPAS